jgi:hypothetical protein
MGTTAFGRFGGANHGDGQQRQTRCEKGEGRNKWQRWLASVQAPGMEANVEHFCTVHATFVASDHVDQVPYPPIVGKISQP